MRVSTQQSYVSMTQSFNDLSSDLSHVVEQMATGKSILLPSDDQSRRPVLRNLTASNRPSTSIRAILTPRRRA